MIKIEDLRTETIFDYWDERGKVRRLDALVWDSARNFWFVVECILDDSEDEPYFMCQTHLHGAFFRDWPKHWKWCKLPYPPK